MMICTDCGGLVTWRGPWHSMTYPECESCGGRNCQKAERADDEEYSGDDDSELSPVKDSLTPEPDEVA